MERVHSPSRKKVSIVEGEGEEVKNEADFETFNPMDTGEADGVDGEKKRLNSQVHDNLRAEIFQMKFDSEDDAHTFYNLFAKASGFSIRKDRRKMCGDNVVMSRKWVCSKQGARASKYYDNAKRKRRPRAETRVGCGALFRVRYDRGIGKYVVTHFDNEHNHPLASPHCVPFLWSHRLVTSADKAQTRAMRDVGMKTSQIMDFMSNQCGGPANLGFIRKDLHNLIQAERRIELKDGDAEGALGYFFSKAAEDPYFFYKYDVDGENRLDKLFWADSRSRRDYAAFGDVLAFDTTYRTNAYKKPFVILAGVSNHYLTTIFGCALLANEKVETYLWVLQTLMEAMDGKRPISVLTDGDKAMRQAIETIFPSCKHRLCMWHLQRNAATNVHVPEFQEDFKRLSKMDCETDVFDNAWAKVVEKYGIENNNWVVDTYAKRHKWAESYLRGHLFVGMRSTQRCEGMNAYFNDFLRPGLRLYEFVGHFDRGLNRMRFKEAEAEAVTENSFPVMQTKLIRLEKHGAELFTRKIFSFFREEIEKEGVLVLNNKIDGGDHRIYYLGKYSSKSTWRLEYHPSLGTIKCSCLKLESFGIPCCHMIFVMKCEQLISIPLGCFMPRWASLERQHPSLPKISQTLTQTARYAMLSSSYNEMAYYASHLDAEFEEAREIAFRMTCRMKKRWEMVNNISNNGGERGNGGNVDGAEENIASKLFGVQDPIVVKTKGNPGGSSSRGVPPKARRCGHCRCIGHTKRTCKKFVGSKQKEGSENDTQEATNVEFTSSYPDDTHGKPGGSSSRGVTPKARTCGRCKCIGHTKRTCKKFVGSKQKEGSENDTQEATNVEFTSSYPDDTHGKPGGSSSRGVTPKARTCGRCKGIGHTKRTCENLDVRNQKEGSEIDMQKATNAEFISSYQNDNHHSASEPRLYKPNHEATVSTDGMWLQS